MKEPAFGIRFTTVTIAFLMIFGGLLISAPDEELLASAGPIPSTVNGDWTVTGTESYDSGTCVLTGNLTIQSGGSLTLNNVTLSINNRHDGEMWVIVDMNGTFNIINSTIKSNTGWKTERFDSRGTIKIVDSTMQDFGMNMSWSGVNQFGGSAVIKRSTFKNNDIGLYISGLSPTIEKCTFTNNAETGLMIDTGTLTVKEATVTNNGAAAGGSGALAAGIWVFFMGNAKIYNSVIKNNQVDGLSVLEGQAEVYNTTISGNSPNDVALDSLGSQSTLDLYNTTFSSSAIDTLGGGTGLSTLKVYWYVNVSATWESDGAPVADGDLEVKDKDENVVASSSLDQYGVRECLVVKEYDEKSTGKTTYTPHSFNVTGTRDSKDRTNGAFLQVTKNHDLAVVLDDLPPDLSISSPEEGFATNDVNITVQGQTEATANVWVNDVATAVGGDGTFSQEIPLPAEGSNRILVRAQDRIGNERQAEVNVTLDTMVPELTVIQPQEGDLFNYTSVVVSGSTEVGANVTANALPVTVEPNGDFQITLELIEGDNKIEVKSGDHVGNVATVTVNVEVDLTPPLLTIGSPTDGFTTSEGSVQVMGMTEVLATVTVNDMPVILAVSSFQTTVMLNEGENPIAVKSCDTAGNCAIETLKVYRDSTPPELTVTYPPTTDEILTKQKEITILGQTEAGADVFVDNKAADVFENGSFSKTLTLSEGLNVLNIRAEDALGNSAKVTRKVSLDTIPPDLDVTYPENNAKVSDTQVTIEGTVEIGAILKINDIGVPFSGTGFSKILDLENEGENVFNVTATDKAGNVEKRTVAVIRDTVILLEIDSPIDGEKTKNVTVTVKGLTDPRASVRVNNDTLTADDNGRFETTLDLEYGDNEIVVKVEDDVGNTKETTITVKRERKSAPPPGGIGGESGTWLWLIILVVVIVVVVIVAVVAAKKRGSAPPPAQPQQEAPAQQETYQQPPNQSYQQPPPPPPQQPPAQNTYQHYEKPMPPPPPPPPPPR